MVCYLPVERPVLHFICSFSVFPRTVSMVDDLSPLLWTHSGHLFSGGCGQVGTVACGGVVFEGDVAVLLGVALLESEV